LTICIYLITLLNSLIKTTIRRVKLQELIQAYYKQIGIRFKNARESARLSQQQIANALGLSLEEIKGYEEGDCKITPDILLNLSKIINIEVRDILGIDEQTHDNIEKSNENEIRYAISEVAKPVIYNTYNNNITHVHHHYGWFSGIMSKTFNADFNLVRNKVVIITMLSIAILTICAMLLRFLPHDMKELYSILNFEALLLAVGFAIITSVLLPINFLTYFFSFYAILKIILAIYIFNTGKIGSLLHDNEYSRIIVRICIYSLAIVLAIIYVQILKKLKKS
jgi:transcriptional regulator with XRE-family HTH domain